MKKHLPLTLATVVLLAVIGALWSRIRTLEAEVNSLRKQVTTDATIMPLRNTEVNRANEPANSVSPFKLLTPARQNDHTDRATNVGVLWEVERAMIGGAHENGVPRQEDIRVEGKIDSPDATPTLLKGE
ncbi:MAG: hypothetical protein U0805_04655 [Pirellulales bacterium]